MIDHADTIRRRLAHRNGVTDPEGAAALDALLAERQQAIDDWQSKENEAVTAMNERDDVKRQLRQAIDERDALAEQIQGRRRGEPLGNCFESVRQALGWPPDASYEGMFADARKAWQEVLDGLSESERKRYDAEARCEQAIDALREANLGETTE